MKIYYEVKIENKQASIDLCTNKPGNAFYTLKRIDRAIQDGLFTSEQDQEELWAAATRIRDGYLKKGENLPFFKWIVWWIESRAVIRVCRQILGRSLKSKKLQDIPSVQMQQILGYLTSKEIARFAAAATFCREHARHAHLIRAREFGFSQLGEESEGIAYLANHYECIIKLAHRGFISRWRATRTFWDKVNPEATARTFEKEDGHESILNKAILDAAIKGDLQMLSHLLALGASVEGSKDASATPLMAACYNGHLEAARLLIESGADVNAISASKATTPLHQAVRTRGSLLTAGYPLAELLLQHGAAKTIDHKDQSSTAVLTYAIERESPHLVHLLLEYGADPNVLDGRGFTPLMWACAKSEATFVDLLLEKKADVNATDGFGRTALSSLYSEGTLGSKVRICRQLLEWGASKTINQQNSYGFTALHSAACFASEEDVALLLEYGVNKSLMDNRWKAPMHYARDQGIRRLLK